MLVPSYTSRCHCTLKSYKSHWFRFQDQYVEKLRLPGRLFLYSARMCRRPFFKSDTFYCGFSSSLISKKLAHCSIQYSVNMFNVQSNKLYCFVLKIHSELEASNTCGRRTAKQKTEKVMACFKNTCLEHSKGKQVHWWQVIQS